MMRTSLALISCACLLPIASQAGGVRGEVSAQALAALPALAPADACFWRLAPFDLRATGPVALLPAALVVLESPDATNLQIEPLGPTAMTFEGYGLSPEVVVLRVGENLTFRNRDGHPYSCDVEGGSDSFRLDGLKPGESRDHKFLSSGILRVRCDSLPFLRAQIVVTPSPLAAPIDSEGRFAFRNVPAGTYQARVFAAGSWHWTTEVRIPAAGLARLELGPRQTGSSQDSGDGPDDPAADTRPSSVDQSPDDPQRPPAQAEPKPPAAEKKPPAAEKKPPAAEKKPPVAEKKPPAAEKKPPADKKPPKAEPEPGFKDVEPEIEIEIEIEE